MKTLLGIVYDLSISVAGIVLVIIGLCMVAYGLFGGNITVKINWPWG